MIDPTLRQRAHEALSWPLNSVDPADWPGKAPEIELLGAPMPSHAAVTCDSETICYTPYVDDLPGGPEQLAAALADAGPVIRDLLAALDQAAPVRWSGKDDETLPPGWEVRLGAVGTFATGGAGVLCWDEPIWHITTRLLPGCAWTPQPPPPGESP